MEGYNAKIEGKMKKLYNNLSEKDKRHYAAIEAMKLGHGGIQYIERLFGVSRETIRIGIKELDDVLLPDRIRQKGGGRPPLKKTYPNVDEAFLKGD